MNPPNGEPSPALQVLYVIMDSIERRAKRQNKTKHLEPIYKTAFDPMLECFKKSAPTQMGITVDAMFRAHAGMIALIKLTNADDLMELVRPGMLAWVKEADFQRAMAAEINQPGKPQTVMTPELYFKMLDALAERILTDVGA